MANKRMFSLDVIGTDSFMDMPLSTQALYFHLGMRADDDGFISSPKQIIKSIDCKQDDMKILISKGYVIPFESGVVVIRHWNQNNYLRQDRYKQTRFISERNMMKLENGIYDMSTNGIPVVYQMATQVSIDKNSIEKNSIEKDSISCPEPDESVPDTSGILLPLIDKSFYDVPKESIKKWSEAYPAVDVEQQLKRMIAWLDANPKRRKTRRGINTFINTWLSREQDKGGRYRNGGQKQELTPEDYELPQEYKEMYRKISENYKPSPDDPFQ